MKLFCEIRSRINKAAVESAFWLALVTLFGTPAQADVTFNCGCMPPEKAPEEVGGSCVCDNYSFSMKGLTTKRFDGTCTAQLDEFDQLPFSDIRQTGGKGISCYDTAYVGQTTYMECTNWNVSHKSVSVKITCTRTHVGG